MASGRRSIQATHLDAIDGFFVHDFTLPTFKNGGIVSGTGGVEKDEFYVNASVGLALSAALGPIKGGGIGSIDFYAGLDLQDIEQSVLTKNADGYVEFVAYVSDGRIRGSEIATMFAYENGGFGNLFNIQMSADFVASIFVELDLWIKTITLYRAELFRVNLFDLEYNAPKVEPYLAEQSGDTLTLNFGDRAAARKYFGTEDVGEEVTLYGSGGSVSIEYDGWYKTYNGVKKVVANFGEGDDKIDLTRLRDVTFDLKMGTGNDVVYAREGGGVIDGGDGKDSIQIGYFETGTVENEVEQIDHGQGRIEKITTRVYTPGSFLAGVGTSQGWTIIGGDGDDVLTGALGRDTLQGDAGNDRLTAGGGDDVLIGGTGNDRLTGGGGRDTYVFEDDFGEDRFSDSDGTTILDYSRIGNGVTVSVTKRGVSTTDNRTGQEVRVSGTTVDEIRLTAWSDTVYATGFPEWKTDIIDAGGEDDYFLRLDRASAKGDAGTFNIIETGSDFDEIIVEQTRATTADDAVRLGLGMVVNGREIVTYDNALVERLTLTGKGAAFDAAHLESLGGDVRFSAMAGETVMNLGNTELRAIARTIWQESALMAGGVIWESTRDIKVLHDITLLNSGDLDFRTYGDGSDVELHADIYSSSNLSAGTDGSSWMRIQVADGSLINTNASRIEGANAYLMVKAKDAVGSFDKPILTRIAELTVATAGHGLGNVVFIEDDDLVLREEKVLNSYENPGYVIATNPEASQWEDKQDWISDSDAGAAEWRNLLQKNRSNIRADVAIEVAHGDLQIDLLGNDALLKLDSGFVRTLELGRFISLTSDDLDLMSGANQLVGSGLLTLRTHKNVSDYYLGTSAEDKSGVDYGEESTQQIDRPGFYLSSRDIAAIADGFAQIDIGRRDLGNVMNLGDIKIANQVKFVPESGPILRGDDNRVASLRDETFLYTDTLFVEGDVQSPDDTLHIRTRKMQVSSQNVQDPQGSADSGIFAKQLDIIVDEQAVVTGWLRATDQLDLTLTGATGDAGLNDGYLKETLYQDIAGPLSLQIDSAATIETFGDGAALNITTAHSIETSGLIQIHGSDSTINMTSGGPIILVELSRILAEADNATINILSQDVVAVNSGTETRAGNDYVDDKEVITGVNGTLNIVSQSALLLGGSVAASGDMLLSSKAQKYDNAVYALPTLTDGTPNPDFVPRYSIFNKTGYFAGIADASPDHYLVAHTGGYGMLVTGTISSLGDGKAMILRSDQDVIVRGNVNATGADASLTLQSDEFLFVEGFVTATTELNLYGGVDVDGNAITGPGARSDARGSSVYIFATGEYRTTSPDGDITVKGAEDVDIFGALIAGGVSGDTGVTYAVDDNGDGASDITVAAGQQIRLESGLQASGNVTLTGGTPGADDHWDGANMTTAPAVDPNQLSVLVNTSGGITAYGLGAGGEGSTVSISGGNRMELMGYITSGGRLNQTFGLLDPTDPGSKALLAQDFVWTGRDSDIKIESTGRVFIGGSTLNEAGAVVQTGGYLTASRLVDVAGGADAQTGMGLIVHAAAEIVTEGRWDYAADGTRTRATGETYSDGDIRLYGVGDMDMQGLLVAGGRSDMIRDNVGKYIGRNVVRYDVDLTITVQADRQIIVGTDITAGKSVDLIGGLDTRVAGAIGSATQYDGMGLVLYGSAQITTQRADSTINLNAPGDIAILAPGDIQELVLGGWADRADGILADDVTVIIQIDKVSYTIEAAVTVRAADTANNTTISSLLQNFNDAMAAATWTVVQTDDPNGVVTPALQTEYAGLAAVPNDTPGSTTPDINAKLRDGRIRLVGPYEVSVLASSTGTGTLRETVNGADLGVVFDDTTPGAVRDVSGTVIAATSGRRFAMDAAAVGSIINIGAPQGPNGGLYIAGKIRAHTNIVMNTGNAAAGKGVNLDVTGILETLDGDISFDLGSSGTLKGDLIARGAGHDVRLASEGTLTIQGLVQADDAVVLSGGTNALSLLLEDTSTIRAVDAGGSITITGTNQVVINGQVETLLADQVISISSDLGQVLVTEIGGRIYAAGQLDISGDDLLLEGEIKSTFVSATTTPEIRLASVGNIRLNSNLTAAGDLRLDFGQFLTLEKSAVKAGSVTVSGDNMTVGGSVLNSGATLDAGAGLTAILPGDLIVNAGGLITAGAANAKITIEAVNVTVTGVIHAGAEIQTGAAVATGDGGDVAITASNTIRLGGVDATGAAAPGNVFATGNIVLNGGTGYGNVDHPGAGLWIDNNSTVKTLNVAETASGNITLNSLVDVRVDGALRAEGAGGELHVNADRMITISGLVFGHTLVDIQGGLQNPLANSVTSTAVAYLMNTARGTTAAGAYFVDEQGRWMTSDGSLVLDASGAVVTEDNTLEAASISATEKGGNPSRLRGAIIDTGAGGEIRITGSGGLLLDGIIGQASADPTDAAVTTAKTDKITITGAQDASVLIRADMNALNAIDVTGSSLSVLEGSALVTWGAGSHIELVAQQNLFVESDRSYTVAGGATVNGLGNAIISSAGWLHLRGSTVYQGGDIAARDNIWINAARDVSIYGSVKTADAVDTARIDIRAGLSAIVPNGAGVDAARNTIDPDTLGFGSIYVLGKGAVVSDGNISLLAGVDVEMDASASAGGTRQVLTPILSSETIETDVITGYNQVIDAVIDVPVVNWVTTTVTEQVGLESVKIGYSFTVMDVKLSQDAYYNGISKREYFVEGVDYRNTSQSAGTGPVIDWGTVAAPGNDSKGYAKTFAELSDLQVEVVLKQLGYKKLYTFSTDPKSMFKYQVLNGTSSRLDWTPDWILPVAAGKTRAMHTVNLQVDGLRDKWITLPVGAEADLARAVSQGSVTKLADEKVGTYKDTATVYYDQVTSAYQSRNVSATEALHDPNESYYKSINTIDNDNSPAYWKVSYDAGQRGNGETASPDNGKRVFTIYDTLGTGVVARKPEWTLNNDQVAKYDAKSQRNTIAQQLFYDTTAQLANRGIDANVGNSGDNHVAVGTEYFWISKQYNISDYSLTHFAATQQFTLANVTNNAQRAAVGALYPSGSAWLGMIYQRDTGRLFYDVSYSSYSSNSVSWYSGGTTSYSNWNSGEPNNSGGFEYAVEQYFANDRFNDLNGYQGRWFIYETGNKWGSTTKYEDFKDYQYNWTSTDTDIMQARYQLDYQWVSNETPEYDNRPKFRTYNTQTKVVDTAKQTLYKDVAIIQKKTETRTVRLEGGIGGTDTQTFATFDSNSVDGRDIQIVSGRDTRLSGNLNADRNLVITTDRDFRLGETPDGIDPATFVPTSSSQMVIGGTLAINASRAIQTDLASLVTVTGTTQISAAKDIDLKGDLVAAGNVTVTTQDDLDAFGVLKGATVDLRAGTDGRGSVLTTLRTGIDAVTLNITAGAADGDITFRDSAVDVTGTMTLTATGGGFMPLAALSMLPRVPRPETTSRQPMP